MSGRSTEELLIEIRNLLKLANNADVVPLADLFSVYFLPPAFLTGWFGMNFERLPGVTVEKSWQILVGLCVTYAFGITGFLLTRKGSFNALTNGKNELNDAQRNQRKQFFFVLSFLALGVTIVLGSAPTKAPAPAPAPPPPTPTPSAAAPPDEKDAL